MRNNKVKLVMAFFTVFIVMPINGYLFTIYPIWFPLLLTLAQAPFFITLLLDWYKMKETPNERPYIGQNPGHRNPPVPPRRRNNNNNNAIEL